MAHSHEVAGSNQPLPPPRDRSMPIRDPERRRIKQREYQKKFYANNREAQRAAMRKWSRFYQDQNNALILAHLKANPCVDCGEADPIVLEFDHRDPAQKAFNIGMSRRRYSAVRIQAEIDKCDVRCCNCHRRRSYAMQGGKCKG